MRVGNGQNKSFSGWADQALSWNYDSSYDPSNPTSGNIGFITIPPITLNDHIQPICVSDSSTDTVQKDLKSKNLIDSISFCN